MDIIAFVVTATIVCFAIWHLVVMPTWRHWHCRHEDRRPGYIDLRPRH